MEIREVVNMPKYKVVEIVESEKITVEAKNKKEVLDKKIVGRGFKSHTVKTTISEVKNEKV